MIKENELKKKKEKLDSIIKLKLGILDLETLGREYRRRADVNINLYLTRYVLGKEHKNCAESAIHDYEKAIELLSVTNSYKHLAEAILAYGNAIKEQYLPSHKQKGISFTEFEKKAKMEYEKCVELTLNINYLEDYYFTMLEQMNLEVRKKIWEQKKSSPLPKPKRIAIFHSLKSPLSHQFLKGVYYFAYKNSVEVWEYNYGRISDSNKNETFISNRLEDASGVVFLASPEYDKREEIIKFEIETTKKLKKKKDPIEIFVLDIGNKGVVEDLKDIKEGLTVAPEEDFGTKIEEFLKRTKDIYYCRKRRLKIK